jgi:hypothetical protein
MQQKLMGVNCMTNDRNKIILFIIFDVVLIFGTIFLYNLVVKNNINNASAIVVEGIDGKTTIYISTLFNWRIILVYSLSFLMNSSIILTIIKIIEYKMEKNISSKLKIIIILPMNLLLTILVFPDMVGISILIDIVIIIIFIIVKIKRIKK